MQELLYIINDDLERLQVGDPGGIYIDNYWTWRQMKTRCISLCTWCKDESVTSEVGYIIQDEWNVRRLLSIFIIV